MLKYRFDLLKRQRDPGRCIRIGDHDSSARTVIVLRPYGKILRERHFHALSLEDIAVHRVKAVAYLRIVHPAGPALERHEYECEYLIRAVPRYHLIFSNAVIFRNGIRELRCRRFRIQLQPVHFRLVYHLYDRRRRFVRILVRIEFYQLPEHLGLFSRCIRLESLEFFI